jgi:hypothetical protein
MIAFNDDGVLPPGIHDFSLGDIGERFGSFNQTGQRPSLYRKLLELVEQISGFSFVRHIILDGSFVTAHATPQDIDLMLVVDPEVLVRAEPLNPFEYNAISSRRLRKRYGFDVFVVPEGSSAYESYVRFFSRIKNGNPRELKGLVRVRFS